MTQDELLAIQTPTADSMSIGRDYRSGFSGTRYEYVIFSGEGVIYQLGGFTSYSSAKSAGIKKARAINEASPQYKFAQAAKLTTTPPGIGRALTAWRPI